MPEMRAGEVTGIERRFVEAEIRADEGQGEPRLIGYPAVFNSWSEPLWGMFREKIEPGAFAASLSRGDDVRALINHDANFPLGRTTAGNLKLAEDERGLKMDLAPTKTSFAADLLENVRAGVVSQMSFAFRVKKDEWAYSEKEGELDERTIMEVDLIDVSPVTYPAYPATSLQARELCGADVALRSREEHRKKTGPVKSGLDETKPDGSNPASGNLAIKRRKLELLEKGF